MKPKYNRRRAKQPKPNSALKIINTLVFITSLIVFFISDSEEHQFQTNPQYSTKLQKEPIQTTINKSPFELTAKEMRYVITPLYDYTLYGLVVSVKHHNSNIYTSYHSRWKDYANIADVCVVWGKNLDIDLNLFEFVNRRFTCFVKTDSWAVWDTFDIEKLSNNHLLAADDDVKKDLADLRRGDQIQLKGWLSNYKSPETGYERHTSVNRTDKGNGACETIFVKSINILDRVEPKLNFVYWGAISGILFSICFWFWAVGTGRF